MEEMFSTFWTVAATVDLNGVAAGLDTGVGQNLKNLRAIAESVRSEREPAARKVGGDIDGTGSRVGRRRGTDLRSACDVDVGGGLRAEKNLRGGLEILTGENG